VINKSEIVKRFFQNYLDYMFFYYSFLNQFFNVILNLSPPPLRMLVLRMTLGKCGRGVLIDYGCYLRYPSKIHIGKQVSINRGCSFYPSFHFRDAYIILEDNVVIAPSVTFLGAGQDPRSLDLADIGSTIRVCSGAYIGANSTIRYGVTIGKNSIVAAGSVVVKDVEEGTIVGGVPAQRIRTR